jgi:hypothetical protein
MITDATLYVDRPTGNDLQQTVRSNTTTNNEIVFNNLPAGTKITVGASILPYSTGNGKNALITNPNNTCNLSSTVNSADPGTVKVYTLRNGDTPPNLTAFGGSSGAASLDSYLTGYINTTTRKITIQPNQVIYLFELVGSPGQSYYDLQDTVVLGTIN